MTHFPPLFSITLAALNWVGVGSIVGARWLNIGLFGATIILSGLAVWSMSSSNVFSLLGAALVLTAETLLGLHTWALSEPLFLCLALGGLVGLAAYIQNPRRRPLLFLSSGLLGAAYLTRYVGLSLVVCGGIAIAAIPRMPSRHRLVDMVQFLLFALFPMSVWMARNTVLTGNPVDSPPPAWHPPDPGQLQQGAQTLLTWVLPDLIVQRIGLGASLAAAGTLLIIFLGLSVWRLWAEGAQRKADRSPQVVLTLLLLLFGMTYSAILLVSMTYVVRITPLDERILSPLLLVGVLLVASYLACGRRRAGIVLRLGIAGACILFLAFQTYRAFGVVGRLQQDGQGYASNTWRNSPTIAFVRQLDEVPIFTNDLPALYFLAGRISSYIPTEYNPAAAEARADYRDWLTSMHSTLEAERGVLVIFGGDPLPIEPVHLADLTEGLELEARFPDGAVFAPVGND